MNDNKKPLPNVRSSVETPISSSSLIFERMLEVIIENISEKNRLIAGIRVAIEYLDNNDVDEDARRTLIQLLEETI